MSGVVVTGLGAMCALGRDTPSLTAAMYEGICGIGPISRFDASAFRVRVAAEIKGYQAGDHFPRATLGRLDRFSQYAVLCAREAVTHAGLDAGNGRASRTAVVLGTGVGGQESQEETYRTLFEAGSTRLHPFSVPRLMPSAAASHVSIDQGIKGPVLGTVSACASAGHAICMAAMMIRGGLVDAALAGGSEACITPGSFRAWEALRVMAPDTCRPFSAGRGGMVIGEGAAVLVLESATAARARGARVLAELIGVGMAADAHDLVQPTADGMTQAMRAALDDAAVDRSEVDYVNAHGTGTGHNDTLETQALRQVFGAHADALAVSSTKSMCGHLLGASAAIEAVATVVALLEQKAPPTVGYLGADPSCDLDYVPNVARPMTMRVAQSNSFGFGGLNTVLLFRCPS
jgi:nodulation protein E